jgi:hypothetical protein
MRQRYQSLIIPLLFVLAACSVTPTPGVTQQDVSISTIPAATEISQVVTPTATATVAATLIPTCFLSELPVEIATSYAIQGWQEFSIQAGFTLMYFYFPTNCPANNYERDAQAILYGGLIPEGVVGLVILNPVVPGVLGVLYKHLVLNEYWQMGPEDYPAVVDNMEGMDRNLIFLRVNELNGDDTIIGNPLTVLTSLAEHEYIHIAQSRNNPDLAQMVWSDSDYQAFIEGYANIGNVSSQRYYFETQDAIVMLQNLDLMNRADNLQSRIASALENQGSNVSAFLAADPPVYDRHIHAFFLRVGGQAYVDRLRQGEISPYALFTRAGSGDLTAYSIIKEIFKN